MIFIRNLLATVALVGLVVFIHKSLHPNTRAASDEPASANQEPAWEFRNFPPDRMTGLTYRQASFRSVNTIDFAFPYNGPQHAELIIQEDGTETGEHIRYLAVLKVRGQFNCDFNGLAQVCLVAVRFDDGPIEWAHAPIQPNGKPDAIALFTVDGPPVEHFWEKPQQIDFIDKLRKARRVRISASFYQENDQTFEFRYGQFPFYASRIQTTPTEPAAKPAEPAAAEPAAEEPAEPAAPAEPTAEEAATEPSR